MSSKKQHETFDVVQWDGLKETALAFFGMDIISTDLSKKEFFFDEADSTLWWLVMSDGAFKVEEGMWLLKDSDGVWLESDADFNNEYEIIDEYPA